MVDVKVAQQYYTVLFKVNFRKGAAQGVTKVCFFQVWRLICNGNQKRFALRPVNSSSFFAAKSFFTVKGMYDPLVIYELMSGQSHEGKREAQAGNGRTHKPCDRMIDFKTNERKQ